MFDGIERGPGRAVLLSHVASQLEADTVVLVQHPAVFERGAGGCRPYPVVELQGFVGILRWVVYYEAVVDHNAPWKPVREMGDVLRLPLGETLLDRVFLRPVKPLD